MKLLLLNILLWNSFFLTRAQDINAIINEGEKLEKAFNEEAALVKFKEALRIQPSNLHVLSKCSELCSRIGKRQADEKQRNSFYESARQYAQAALKIQPTNSDANCAMAIALGRISMSKSGKEKITAAKDIKKFTDAALKSNPSNFKALHVLGRWYYEISNLNMFEKAAVKIFYGGLPAASIEDAIAAFEKAQTFSGGVFLLNYLELAKAYYKNDDEKKAINTLQLMLGLPNQTEDDATIKQEAKSLLKKWS